jgi:UDPglucose 6-dehydrogenase
MMRIGFVGLGKLGLPCAVAIAEFGHEVIGYDVDPKAMNKEDRPVHEAGPDGRSSFNDHLASSSIRFGTLDQVVNESEIILVAVQTPHDPRYEGVNRIPDERMDFDYTFLVDAVRAISEVAREDVVVAIISTVLPGTIERHVKSVASSHLRLCYTPQFIAMGTTMRDFLNPEFVLLGVEDPHAADLVEGFFATITKAPVYRTSVESAELIKVSYNTFIGMKIAFANTMLEICHKTTGTDVDAVMGAIKLADQRLISTAYLDGGMGDGGGCHPRDNIAMSWLARSLDLSHDLFEDIMLVREQQTDWLADLMEQHDLPKAILGYAFKPETNITVGSSAVLLRNLLEERGHDVRMIDPLVTPEPLELENLPAHVFLVGARHDRFTRVRFPVGSVVIDPWRYLHNVGKGVTLIPVGAKQVRGGTE